MGSAAKILAICFLVIIGMLFVILSLPKGTSNAVIILLTMMFSFFGLVIYTTMFACMEEVSIPPQYTGIAVSVISLLGYLPDGLFPPCSATGSTCTAIRLLGHLLLPRWHQPSRVLRRHRHLPQGTRAPFRSA